VPTYEYECQKCGHRFEEFQSMKDAPLTQCPRPKCRGKVKRLIGAGAGFLFKGSGFYITDYRSSSYQDKKKGDAPKSESSGKSEPSGKSESSGKSKSAPKSAAKSEQPPKKKPD
jgi:putative FmdB family regulatory protein